MYGEECNSLLIKHIFHLYMKSMYDETVTYKSLI